MQYILSKSELDDLTNKKSNYLVNKELNKVDLLKRDLQLVCTYAADNVPIKFWGREELKPWGCIMSRQNTEWYCDECPVHGQCPNEDKEWSK